MTLTTPMMAGNWQVERERRRGRQHEGPRQCGALIRANTSARVASLVWMSPRTALVTVLEPGVRTPRMLMHRCSASMSTSAPVGCRDVSMASATSLVIRSWSCGRAATWRTTRASLLSPAMWPWSLGM